MLQLASIPGLEKDEVTNNNSIEPIPPSNVVTPLSADTVDESSIPTISVDNNIPIESESAIPQTTLGPKACEDVRYRKYFKMLQFGVLAPAVKLKMVADGLDARLLE